MSSRTLSPPLAHADDVLVLAMASKAAGAWLYAAHGGPYQLSSVLRSGTLMARALGTPADACESHMVLGMDASLEEAVNEWHASVNAGDPERSERAVGDPVVVLGPKGAGPITPAQFADWVERSGIQLIPRSWYPVSERLMVVEEDASWPESTKRTRVATVFRASDGKITAALRLPDLKAALELAYICRELAATE